MLHTLSSLTVYMQNQNTVYSMYPIGKSKFKKSTYWALDGKKNTMLNYCGIIRQICTSKKKQMKGENFIAYEEQKQLLYQPTTCGLHNSAVCVREDTRPVLHNCLKIGILYCTHGF